MGDRRERMNVFTMDVIARVDSMLNICEVCFERIEEVYDMKVCEWILVSAVGRNGHLFHKGCLPVPQPTKTTSVPIPILKKAKTTANILPDYRCSLKPDAIKDILLNIYNGSLWK